MSDIIVGRNAVLEALRHGRGINKIIIQEGAKGGSLGEIIALARETGIALEYAPASRLEALAEGNRHQGVAAQVAPIAFRTLEDALERAQTKGEVPFLVLLDELQDPQNVGALIRSADAAGVHGILLPGRRSCPLNMTVAKISAGAVEYVPVIKIGNIVQTIKSLQQQGFWVVGADMSGETFYRTDLRGPLVLVIGAEGKGLGRLVKESCDSLVSIPMAGGVSSLNASVAGAILMYEVVRQRSS